MAIEIVNLPINSMVIFHGYVNVYQRVTKPLERLGLVGLSWSMFTPQSPLFQLCRGPISW